MSKITIAALDGALANFGMAKLQYDITLPADQALSVLDLKLIHTEKSKVKSVRASSDRLRRSREIAMLSKAWLADCAMVFVEVPSGGQSHDATFAFGIVTGLYASLPLEPIEVSPAETKLAAVGTRTASKEEMIEWASGKFPAAPWLTTKRNGLIVPTKANEHLADAVAIAHAGIRLPVFQQTIAMISAMNAAT